ncbi:MAG: hypothetical protein V1882_02735 [Candidatus Omnitrophota bacterium]
MLWGHGIQQVVDLFVDRLDPLLQGVYFQRRIFELLVQFRPDLPQKLFVRIFFAKTILDPLEDMTFKTMACEREVFTDSVAPAPESAASVRMSFDLFRIRPRGPEIGMPAPGAGDQSRKQIIRSGRPSAELARELAPAFSLLLRREP